MRKYYIYIISILVLAFDQFIKWFITTTMQVGQSFSIIPHFFGISYVQNKGAAWGILEGKTIFLLLVSAVFLILLNRFLIQETKLSKISILGYGLLIGGILGNFCDRLVHKYVIDYLSFHIFKYDFPVFNIADMAIVISIILLIWDIVRGEIDEYRSRNRRA